MPLHKTLKRQIKKYLGEDAVIPEKYQRLLEAISEAYVHSDNDRKLIERSLDLSSKEMNETNNKLREQIKTIQHQATDLEVFNEAMVGRELKMLELKKKLKEVSETCSHVQIPEELYKENTND